jgi:acetyl-CoA decarbonylase/synthase complex subunit gamma
MGLTGIQILAKLPKKNCKECGFPTCLAFAMKVAAGQAEITACPYVDQRVIEEIAEATAPPIRTVKLGGGDNVYFLGGETVLFRHEKRFENPPLIGTFISSAMDVKEINKRITFYKKFKWDRVGVLLRPDVIMIEETNAPLVKRIRDELPWCALILKGNKTNLEECVKVCGDFKPLLYPSKDEIESFFEFAKEKAIPLIISGDNLDEVVSLSEKAQSAGLKNFVLDPGSKGVKELFEDLLIIRRSAIKAKFKPLGFPVITFPYRYTEDYLLEATLASLLILRYASIIILSDLRAGALFNLLVEKLNIYTDPQKPLVVEEGIYPINGPNELSPVAITCNFALTYFLVNGEIEGSRVPTWLLIKDTDGLSVLTAWAAGKFGADTIAEFVKKSGITEKVKHRKLIIPGLLATIKGELEEELPDWEIIVGPREASRLPTFLRQIQEKIKAKAA